MPPGGTASAVQVRSRMRCISWGVGLLLGCMGADAKAKSCSNAESSARVELESRQIDVSGMTPMCIDGCKEFDYKSFTRSYPEQKSTSLLRQLGKRKFCLVWFYRRGIHGGDIEVFVDSHTAVVLKVQRYK